MSYEVLARRLRPKKFAEVIGQEHVTKALQSAIKEKKLHHAYLLTGTRGVGKTTVARILAKAVNCLNVQDGEPCGHCEICQGIDKERFPDLLAVSYTHLRAHETKANLVCRLLLEKKKGTSCLSFNWY